MTLKNKLAQLRGLQSEEERIKNEISYMRKNIEDMEMRRYNYEELREKYAKLDFTQLTETDLTQLMVNDFADSNLAEIEKRELYTHNMKVLETILNKVKAPTINLVNNNGNKDDIKRQIKQAMNINTELDSNVKTININSHEKITARDDDDLLSEDELDDDIIELLNNKIDYEYDFNLKILKTYCVYCHYRNIKLPTQEELDYIKEELEGWIFVPHEELTKLSYKKSVIYLTIENEKILCNTNSVFKCLTNRKDIIIQDKLTGDKIMLGKLNPIFRKITLKDIDT